MKNNYLINRFDTVVFSAEKLLRALIRTPRTPGIALLLLIIAGLSKLTAQPLSFSASPQTQCYTGFNTATLLVGSTPSNAVSFSWSVTGTGCSPVITPAGNGSLAVLSFSCCGFYTVSCFALDNLSAIVDSFSSAVTVQCPSFISISGNTNLCPGMFTVLSYSGASSYTTFPGNQVGPTAAIAPSVSTTYTVTGTNGACIVTSTIHVTVHTPPFVGIGGGTPAICSGSTLSVSASGSAVSYTWFPSLFTGFNLTVTPSASSCLTLVGAAANGCTNSATYCYSVLTSPTISVSGNATVCSGGTVVLTASGALTYSWNTGATGNSVSVTPQSYACYSVAGTGVNGCTAMAAHCVTVPPTPTISISHSVHPNGSVGFTASATPPSSAATFYWIFGNSTTFSVLGVDTTSTTYTAAGVYTVQLNYSAPGMCPVVTTISCNVPVPNCSLVANFTYTQGVNGVVHFSNTSTGADTLATYFWNFGDNSTSVIESPTHTYVASGPYNVVLIVTNTNQACADTVLKPISINIPPCNVVASFSYSSAGNGSVNFVSTSTGTLNGYHYSWDFGDQGAGTGISASHHYTSNGTYQVKLTVKNFSVAPTCIDDTIIQVSVDSIPCPALLTAGIAHTVTGNGQVQFGSGSAGTNTSTAYLWNFGDGFGSTQKNPLHQYNSAGAHIVSLKVTNKVPGYCADSTLLSINITGIPCFANSNFTLVPGDTAHYWNAIPAYPWNVTAATWDWGDGSSDNSLYASHIYSAASAYSICLSVTVSCSASASTCTSYSVFRSTQAMNMVYVNVRAPALILDLDNQQFFNSELTIFPNPGTGIFNLSGITRPDSQVSLILTNLVGKILINSNLYVSDGMVEEKLDLTGLDEGIYFLIFHTENQRVVKKIVLNK